MLCSRASPCSRGVATGRAARRGRGRGAHARRAGAWACATEGAATDEAATDEAASPRDKFAEAMGKIADTVSNEPRFFKAEVARVEQVAAKTRDVTVLAEVSRELVPLVHAYKQIGQRGLARKPAAKASARGVEVPLSSAPPPIEVYEESLDRLRGDIASSDAKVALEPISTKHEVTLHANAAKHRLVYDLQPGDEIELGAFQGAGMSFRPIQFIFGYPTVLIAAAGDGVASAKALIECGASDRGLCFHMRERVHLYQREDPDGSLRYEDRHAHWADEFHVDVRRVAKGRTSGLQEAFDADDLVYDPDATAAIVFDGGDPGFRMAALKLFKEAGVGEAVTVSATKDGDAIFLENLAVTDDEKRKQGIA